MSDITIALKFLRDNARVVMADDYFEEFEELHPYTQTAWLEEAIKALQTQGKYTLPAKYTKAGEDLVLKP